jgi:Holliday junction resolvasome RuvABC endonuclease subunit
MPNGNSSILSIDPGTRYMGYAGFIDGELADHGVKTIRQNGSLKTMLNHIETIISRLIIEKKPRIVVIEKNNFSQIRQNVRLAIVTQRIKSIAKQYEIRFAELDSRSIRKLVCQNGNATKRELARTICTKYPDLKAYFASDRRWKEKYYQNIFDAIGCGMAYLAKYGEDRHRLIH